MGGNLKLLNPTQNLTPTNPFDLVFHVAVGGHRLIRFWVDGHHLSQTKECE
jgi:hypothetical protein